MELIKTIPRAPNAGLKEVPFPVMSEAEPYRVPDAT